jgi:hypothetical protein
VALGLACLDDPRRHQLRLVPGDATKERWDDPRWKALRRTSRTRIKTLRVAKRQNNFKAWTLITAMTFKILAVACQRQRGRFRSLALTVQPACNPTPDHGPSRADMKAGLERPYGRSGSHIPT